MLVKNKILIIFCLLIVLSIIISIFNRIPVYERLTQIDINSGKLKIQFYFLNLPIKTKIEKTEFSILTDELGLSQSAPEWRNTNSKTYYIGSYWGVSCSIYKYRNCPVDCKQLLKIFSIENYSTDMKKEIIRSFLNSMQQGHPKRLSHKIQELLKNTESENIGQNSIKQ